jgi:hypothetical protein
MNPAGRSLIRRGAELNGVSEKVEVRRTATRQELLSLKLPCPTHQLLILVDIEGAEYQLIDEVVLNRFRGAKWIIEVHEFDRVMTSSLTTLQALADAFYVSRLLQSGSRNPHQFEELEQFSDVDRWLLCAEGRDGPRGKWLVIG